MAEIKRRKTRMYEPWGYQEENNYQSDENIFLNDLNSFFSEVEYNTEDKKIHFYNKDGEEKASLDVSGFSSSVVESTNYDTTTKILTIKFSNGDVVEINLAELIDENEFGDGLQVKDGIISVLLDESGETYLSVSENGIKLSGVDSAIETAVEVEKARAEGVESSLDERISQNASAIESSAEAISANTEAIQQNAEAISAEAARAASAETRLENALSQEISDRIADVDAEEARATSAEAVLQGNINAEITRATQTEQQLNSRIDLVNDELDAEESIREASDVRLENKIDQETVRATSAETVITNKITELVEELQPLINDTLETKNEHEVAFGQYNISRSGETLADKTVVTVGYGSSDSDRKNLFEVRANGDVYMWVENDFVQINNLLGMLTNEVYDN